MKHAYNPYLKDNPEVYWNLWGRSRRVPLYDDERASQSRRYRRDEVSGILGTKAHAERWRPYVDPIPASAAALRNLFILMDAGILQELES